MTKAKLHQDSHGFFFKKNYIIFRPVIPCGYNENFYKDYLAQSEQYDNVQKVFIQPNDVGDGYSERVRVRLNPNDESFAIWFRHGRYYYKNQIQQSDEIFIPTAGAPGRTPFESLTEEQKNWVINWWKKQMLGQIRISYPIKSLNKEWVRQYMIFYAINAFYDITTNPINIYCSHTQFARPEQISKNNRYPIYPHPDELK